MKKYLKNILLRFIKLILIFVSITKKKYKLTKNGCKYILLRIDVYFTEYLLAVEIDEKGHTDRDLIFEEKRQKALEKKLFRKFIRINTGKEGYDEDYEASRIQTFIKKFKDRQLKKLNKNLQNKRQKKNLTGQTTK